jgi:hypothetical protein
MARYGGNRGGRGRYGREDMYNREPYYREDEMYYRDDMDDMYMRGDGYMFAGVLKDYDEDEWDYYEDMEEERYHRGGGDGRYMRQGVKGTGPYGIGGRLHYPKRGRRRYRREEDYPFDSAPMGEGGIKKLTESIVKENEDMKKDIFKKWMENMKNADGTTGPHFSEEQIKNIYKDEKIKEKDIDMEEFKVVMNMLYSDYCKILKENGMNSQKLYTDLAVAFIKDEDAMKHKTLRYALFIAGVEGNKDEEE